MYCKFCGNHLEDNSVICGRCGSDIDPNDGGQSFYDDEELNEWKESYPLPEMRTIMPTAEISQDEEFDDEIYEKMSKEPTTIMRSGKGSPSGAKRKRRASKKKKTDIYIIAGLGGLIAAIIILFAAFILISRDNENDSNNGEEVTSESSITEDASEAEAKDKPEDKNRDSGAIEIPTDKDITEICSVSDKAIYVYGEKIKLTNSSGDKMDVYSYDPENHDVIYIPFDRLMLAMDYNLADESTSPSSIEVIFEKTEKTEGKNENSLKINGKEVSKVSVKKYEYEVYIDFFDSETGSETKTMLYPVLNMDDEYETYVPAGEFVRALGLNYDEQSDAIYIDEAKSERRKD